MLIKGQHGPSGRDDIIQLNQGIQQVSLWRQRYTFNPALFIVYLTRIAMMNRINGGPNNANYNNNNELKYKY